MAYIQNVNCASGRVYVFHSKMDVHEKSFGDAKCIDPGGTWNPNSRIYAELSTATMIQGYDPSGLGISTE